MEKVSLQVLPAVRPLGRHTFTGGALNLFYTASGFECSFTGSELHLCLRAGASAHEPWISVLLNGAWIARFPVAAGESEICLFRGLTPGVARHVRVLKDVQAMPDEPDHFLQITALGGRDGEFLPLPAPAYRLEFIGDSITSGEGAIGAKQEEDWVSAFFSAVPHYARLTAEALGAEWRIISQSGWGLLSGWDNDPRHRVMDYYEQVCGVAAGVHNAALGAQQPYDFAAWPADAVIINLGTNDVNPIRFAKDTAAADQEEAWFVECYRAFVEKVRRLNGPDTAILCVLGPMDYYLYDKIQQTVAAYQKDTGDQRVFCLKLIGINLMEEGFGSAAHPSLKTHIRMGRELAKRIRQLGLA